MEHLKQILQDYVGQVPWFFGSIIVALIGGAFTFWKAIQDLPRVRLLVSRLNQKSIPKAGSEKYSVFVANLDHDAQGEYKRRILKNLRKFKGFEVRSLDRSFTLEVGNLEASEAQGHDKMRGYLQEAGGSIVIWGSIDKIEKRYVFSLYLTTAHPEHNQSRDYPPLSGELMLLHKDVWNDLLNVLTLLVLTRSAEFSAKQGQYVADLLPDFIAKVRRLLGPHSDSNSQSSTWNTEGKVRSQFALADALLTLGQQSGESQPLTEAIDLYREVLNEWTREKVPLDWATTQNNLGTALRSLGERESGTERLKDAVKAYEAALEERTQEKVPLDWATTQNNLGNALRSLGERESGTERLEAAVKAYEAALKERTQEKVPLAWAATQYNLGIALVRLGERESGTERLESAVNAYEAALKERTQEKVPLSWAMTQNNLGSALRRLGERESGTERLEQAEKMYLGALKLFETARAEYYIENTKANLEDVRRLIDERRSQDNS
ncbi:MAG: tetratricopeptide repeat protein [Verrucomicrobiota bacterium]